MTRTVRLSNPDPVPACRALLGAIALIFAGSLWAEADDSLVCDRISQIASQQTGVPISVLKAISLTETGRKRGAEFRPWPWTVNMEGKGVWFDNEDDARSFVYKHFKRGARSFDVGCFQINYKWHHQNFNSLDEMFDPLINGLYAARFLTDLYREKGIGGTPQGHTTLALQNLPIDTRKDLQSFVRALRPRMSRRSRSLLRLERPPHQFRRQLRQAVSTISRCYRPEVERGGLDPLFPLAA